MNLNKFKRENKLDRYYNPFQNFDLRCPKEFHNQVIKYTQTKSLDGKKMNPDQSPFPRMVDIWFLAMSLGIKNEKKVTLQSENTIKLVEGTIFSSDPWRVEVLLLLSIADNKDLSIIDKPGEIIQTANEFAAAGFQLVFDMLEEGKTDPIYNISMQLSDLFEGVK